MASKIGKYEKYEFNMDQLKDFADSRLIQGCIYCDHGLEETKDHVPSRVFLDPPFPENLPVVPACFSCNNGFGQDEEYLACLIACVLAGTTDPDRIRRSRISDILRRTPALRSRLETVKNTTDGQVFFTTEDSRVKNVIRKLARGHAAFELSLALRQEPTSIMWKPLVLMTDAERESFEAVKMTPMFGEVGSRGMQRLLITQLKLKSVSGEESTVNFLINDWIEVQEGRYRYFASDDIDGVTIKLVIAEYLACKVLWAS